MSERVAWEELPTELRTAVEEHTGKVLSAEQVSKGLNSPAAFIITTAGNGRLFFKGVRLDDPEGVMATRAEESLNRTVAGVSPWIRHRFEMAGWYCLAFIHVDGRHVDFSPGTKDLGPVAFTLNWMARRFTVLSLARADYRPPMLAERFTGFLSEKEAVLLDGTNILHTDTNPHNVMVPGIGNNVYVVDWAMPAVGPAWVDMANTAVRLMEADQPDEDALAWLGGFDAWKTADPRAVKAYVDATCRQWSARVGEQAASHSNRRFSVLLEYPRTEPRAARSRGLRDS
ncbi:phosphotransferase [Streptomyces sp. NPDC047097]|uniref:phosphotransferase n=1 Tax=Streptomyces sp. NPDC047097 TaxID=3155260 RepID=UPI0034067C29